MATVDQIVGLLAIGDYASIDDALLRQGRIGQIVMIGTSRTWWDRRLSHWDGYGHLWRRWRSSHPGSWLFSPTA